MARAGTLLFVASGCATPSDTASGNPKPAVGDRLRRLAHGYACRRGPARKRRMDAGLLCQYSPLMSKTAPTLVQSLANPTRFMALSAIVLPWLASATALVMAYGLYLAFAVSPPDYQQGHTVKIMYVHVPSAWLAMAGYLTVAASSFGLLVWRHPLADVSARAAAPIGAAFTFLALVTGSLWGKPMWGTYWVWDARLTSVLLLFFLYLGLIALRSAIEDEAAAAKLTAILALVGVSLLPVIKFSVEWWNTLHQPSTKLTTTLDASFRTPLLVNAVAFTLLFITMHLMAMRNEVQRRRVKSLQVAAVRKAGG
jgi:heme exporter protein C